MSWLDEFYRHDHNKAERLRKYPVCHACGERIQGEYRYRIDGVLYCEDCLKDLFEEYNDMIEDEQYE